MYRSPRTESVNGMYSVLNRVTKTKHEQPPFGLKIYKGSKEVVISRNTAHFTTQTDLAIKFLDWLKDISCPEEFFFATLARVNQELYYANKTVAQGMKRKKTFVAPL